jgi:Leishmanolysin
VIGGIVRPRLGERSPILGLAMATMFAGAVLSCSPNRVAGIETRPPFRFEARFADATVPSEEVLDVISRAVARWQQVVKYGGATTALTLGRDVCGIRQAGSSVTKGTLVLFVRVTQIDGSGGILAQAAPCALDATGTLPVAARLELDADDVPAAAQSGVLVAIVEHELGHALGFGTLWTQHGLLAGAPDSQLTFTGVHARAAFLAAGGASFPGMPVPVESRGGLGTVGNHWPASVFGAELMTAGLRGLQSAPLSTITIASLEDLGYVVDYSAADQFSVSGELTSRSCAGPVWDLSCVLGIGI